MWKGEESIKKSVFTELKSTIEVLREEVELNNTRAVDVLHIPNTLSLISARTTASENSNTVFLQSTSFK